MTMTQDTITQAKSAFLQAKGGLCNAFASTPDDRLNWSPSPTSRTPIQQVSHAAYAIKNIHNFLIGDLFPIESTVEADQYFREQDSKFSTRDEALALLEQNCDGFVAYLDSLTPDQLATMIKLPFKLGEAPVGIAITFPASHTQWHQAQIEYIQTIYGDHDWHIGM